jgi:hypothetical protein
MVHLRKPVIPVLRRMKERNQLSLSCMSRPCERKGRVAGKEEKQNRKQQIHVFFGFACPVKSKVVIF